MAPVAVRRASEAFGSDLHPDSQTRATRRRHDSTSSDESPDTLLDSRRTYGIITRVSMMNFMCHSNLTIKLGPEINLIMGRNGSGKSTILTALSTCLGGKASNTNRASRIGALVKEGEEKALIEVEFSNEGEGAFLPQIYGSKIIVERSVKRNGATAYKIKNSSGKTVSSRRSDLSDILDHFHIFIDNPFTILTQDMARAFLTASTPDSKFKHFYSGLQFDKVATLQASATEQLKLTETGLHSYKEVLANLKQKRNEKKSMLKRANDYEQSLQEAKLYRSYLMWENAREVKVELSKVDAELNAMEKNKQDFFERNSFFDDKKQSLTNEIELVEEEKLLADSETTRLNGEKRELTKEIRITDESIRNMQRDLRSAKDQMIQKEASRNAIQQKIDTILERGAEAYGRERVANEKKILELTSEVSKYATLIVTEEEKENDLSAELENLKRDHTEDLGRISSALNRLTAEIKDLESHKRELLAGESKKYQGYPAEIKILCDRIAKSRSRFTDKVIGPVGSYVALKDATWSTQLEAVLHNSLNGFLVFNEKDCKTLMALVSECHAECAVFKRPKDLFGFEHSMPNTKYQTIYDILEFKDEYVKRFLIDQHYIESVLIVKDRNEAEDFMKRNPPKVRSILTLDPTNPVNGYTVGGHKSAAVAPLDGRTDRPRMATKDTKYLLEANANQTKSKNEECARLRQRQESLKAEIREAEAKLAACTQQLSVLHRNKRAKEKAISDLSALLERDDQREDLEKVDAFRQQLESINHERAMYEDQYITAEAQVQKLVEDKKVLHQRISALDKDIRIKNQMSFQARTKIEDLNQKLQNLSNEKAGFANTLEEYDRKISIINSKKSALEEKLNEVSAKAHALTGSQTPVYMPEHETKESVNAKILYCQQIVEQVEKELGRRSYDDVVKLVEEAEAEYDAAKEQYKEVALDFRLVSNSKTARQENYEEFKINLCSSVARSFRQNLANRGFEGDLSIDLLNQKLNMMVGPSNGKLRDVSTLSGGEKSFSQVALLVAIWITMNSRLVALDEFDVFMDKINRRISLSMVIDALKLQSNVQSIFITPQDVDIEAFTGDSNHVNIHRMADPERGS